MHEMDILEDWLNYQTDEEDSEETMTEAVVVTNNNDVIDVTGLDCPVCFTEFKTDQVVIMFGCSLSHFLCLRCAGRFEVGGPCHFCRAPIDQIHIFKGEVFNKGEGTQADPIIIND